MIVRHVLSRQYVTNTSCLNSRILLLCNNVSSITATPPPSSSPYTTIPLYPQSYNSSFSKSFHSFPESTTINANPEFLISAQPEPDETDEAMNDFLSRFVHIMRGKLNEAYPGCDKPTVDAMLTLIVEKVVQAMEKGDLVQMIGKGSGDLSEDLWGTVVEVSKMVCDDMEKELRKEKMKKFLQSEEVKVMVRFASEIGIRGDMLRELRFKWAREKMEESELYESLAELKEEESKTLEEDKNAAVDGVVDNAASAAAGAAGEEKKAGSLPKRKGKIKYKIYGLDLSDAKWKDVADKIHEAGEVIWPRDAKPITGRCKLVTEQILSLNSTDDPLSLLSEWKELLHPDRVDWMSLLDRLKDRNASLYFKIAEHLLSDPSFQSDVRDYSQLIDGHAKENRVEDAERILQKMVENGVSADILTLSTLVHLYSKRGDIERAKESFKALKALGFKPDTQVYGSMIKAYVKAGDPKAGESLMREMETKGVKPTHEIYMDLLQSFSQSGDVGGVQRISTNMQFDGFQPNLETGALIIEAFGLAENPEQARSNFDYIMKIGMKPDDRCVGSMIVAYEKKNMLDKALQLLLQLEKDGFEPGLMTNTVLVDWFCKLLLVDEAEQILGKIAQQGETPPLKLQVSFCDMYARCGNEKKALQTLGVLEAKKDQLKLEDFERILHGLTAGGFVQDAQRIHQLMESQGFEASSSLRVNLMASQSVRGKSDSRWGLKR